MDVFVNVVGQKLKIATNQKRFVVGTQNFIRFVFGISDNWANLTLYAQFKQNGIRYNQTLDDENATYLPVNIVPGEFTLALQGIDSNKIAKTFEVQLLAVKDPFSIGGGGSGMIANITVQDDTLIITSNEVLIDEETLMLSAGGVAIANSSSTLKQEEQTMTKIKKISVNGVVYDIVDEDAQTKISNLPAPPTKLSELSQDENHRTVTDEEKAKWNNDTTISETEVAAVDEA